jgi:hypothetical protein
MADDFLKHNGEEGFYYKLRTLNPWVVDGKTGYEQYYMDLIGFWR